MSPPPEFTLPVARRARVRAVVACCRHGQVTQDLVEGTVVAARLRGRPGGPDVASSLDYLIVCRDRRALRWVDAGAVLDVRYSYEENRTARCANAAALERLELSSRSRREAFHEAVEP